MASEAPLPKVSDTGLTAIFTPADDKHLADIVFVHGLRGHPVHTWTGTAPAPEPNTGRSPSPAAGSGSGDGADAQKRKKWPFSRSPKPESLAVADGSAAGKDVYWPFELLRTDCPQARILTWGYNTNIVEGYAPVDQNNIFAHARNLLAAFERDRSTGRPVIFVAHSLGGIIVKEVLRRSADMEDASFQNIVKSTKAVIFLSTPHRGSPGFAGLGDVVRSVASFALRMDTNDQILTALVGGPELELGRESFPKLWREHKFVVKTFQESQAMSGFNVGLANKRVVPPESSSLDDPREHAEAIIANHITMCKFGSKDDPGYKQVGGELKKRMEDIAKRIRTDIDKIGSACLQSLAFEGMKTRQSNIEAVMEDSCSWLDTNPQYCEWMDRSNIQQHQGFLWVKGKPGSGKSTLMKVTAERLKTATLKEKRIVVAHFFHGRGSGLQKSPLGMLRSLLHKILLEHQPMLDALGQVYSKNVQTEGSKWEWTEEELKVFLRAHLLTPSEYRFDLFVDALDECSDKEAREVVKYFEDLSSSALAADANLNICISSRHYPNINVAKCNEIIAEDENNDDIYQYIIKTLSARKNLNEASMESLAEKIQRKSSGIFLWTVFAVRTVNTDQDNSLPLDRTLEKLDKLPTKLDEMFTQLFEELDPDGVSEAVAIFQILLLAQRPLTFLELRQMISFGGKSKIPSIRRWKEREGTEIANYEWFMKRMLAVSKGLVEIIVDVTVPLKYEDPPPKPDEIPGGIVDEPTQEDAVPNQEDAVQNEEDEQNSDSEDEQDSASTTDDVSNNSLIIPATTATSGIRIVLDDGPPIHMEWSWDSFNKVLPVLISKFMEPQPVRPAQVVIPLHIWDSKHPWGVDLDPAAVAKMQVQFIHETVRDFFLKKGFELLDPSLGTRALGHGHRLLSKSCYSYLSTEEIRALNKTNSSNDWSFGHLDSLSSPLDARFSLEDSDSSLARYGFDYFLYHAREAELEKLTLDYINGDDSNITTTMISKWRKLTPPASHPTVLHFLCNEGLFHSARALIDQNPRLDDDEENTENTTLLYATVKCEKSKSTDEEIAFMVQILLDHGANTEAVSDDFDKVTPLHVAAKRNLSATVTCLLEGGANPNAQDPWRRAPLYKAIHEHGTKIFLSSGSNDSGDYDYSETYNALLSHGADLMQDGVFAHAVSELPLKEFRRLFKVLKVEQLSRGQAEEILRVAVLWDRFDCCLLFLSSNPFCSKLYIESYNDLKRRLEKLIDAEGNPSILQSSLRTRRGQYKELRKLATLLEQRHQEAARAGRTDKKHSYFPQEVSFPLTASLAAGWMTYRWLSWTESMPSSTYMAASIITSVMVVVASVYYLATKSLTTFILSAIVFSFVMIYLCLAELPRLLCDSIWFRLWWPSAILSMYVAAAKLGLFAARLWVGSLFFITVGWLVRHWAVDRLGLF